MCKLTKLQHNIHSITKDGYDIAAFLADTMRGETPGVKVCHRMDAAKHLIKYGFPDADCETTSDRLSRAGGSPKRQGEGGINTPSPSTGEGRDGGEDSPSSMSVPVTHLDILNYQIAHLIRHETADGHTLVEFLIHIMSGRDRPFTPRKFRIKPADRMAAARELLRRGFGDLGSRRKPSDATDEANDYDTLHTDLARRMREYSERGTDTVRFLLEVMSDPDPDLEFTIHHRMSAAQELLRRGWDTNYDNIKPKHLQAYWRDKESTRLSIGQKKTQAGLSTTIDDYDKYDDTDYEAIAKEIREEEDRDDNSKPLRFQEAVPSSRHSSESRNPEDRQAATAQKSLPPRRGKARMGVNRPAQSPFPNKAASEHKDPTTSRIPSSMSLRSQGARIRRGGAMAQPSMNRTNQSSKSSRKRWQAVTTGPPSAPRQSSSAGKSPETSNHTSPPTRTYSPTTDRQIRQRGTGKVRRRTAATDCHNRLPHPEMQIAGAAAQRHVRHLRPTRRKAPRPRHPQPLVKTPLSPMDSAGVMARIKVPSPLMGEG